jgi:hypothetical protein
MVPLKFLLWTGWKWFGSFDYAQDRFAHHPELVEGNDCGLFMMLFAAANCLFLQQY